MIYTGLLLTLGCTELCHLILKTQKLWSNLHQGQFGVVDKALADLFVQKDALKSCLCLYQVCVNK